jgi:hypothetical protein
MRRLPLAVSILRQLNEARANGRGDLVPGLLEQLSALDAGHGYTRGQGTKYLREKRQQPETHL